LTHEGDVSGNIIRDSWQGTYHGFKSMFNLHEQQNMEDFMWGMMGLMGIIMIGMLLVTIREEIVEMKRDRSIFHQFEFVKVVFGALLTIGGGLIGLSVIFVFDMGMMGYFYGRVLSILWILPAIVCSVWFRDWVKANPNDPSKDHNNVEFYGADGRPRKLKENKD